VAGVGKATIYRRYGSKEELVKEAVRRLHQELEVPEDSGSLRGDYAALARFLAGRASEIVTVMPRLLADAADDAELHRIFYDNLVRPRRAVLEMLLQRAIARGEVRADVDLDLAVDLIAGPMIYRLLITGGDVAGVGERSLRVLDAVIEGLGPR
jgi:AcrR family transcriptional regulator